jgi:PAS domain S-box-containing protein
MKNQQWYWRFQYRIILILIGIVILSAVAVGIPAVVIIRSQLNHQAWTQVYQGIQAAEALTQAHQDDLEKMALLTAQRPTLKDLLVDKDPTNLKNYLITLQNGTLLDLIAVCEADQTKGTTTLEMPAEAICEYLSQGGFQTASQSGELELWLTSAQAIPGSNYKVVVGRNIGDQFSSEISKKIGLEYAIWVGESQIASSFTGSLQESPRENLERIENPLQGIQSGHRFKLEGILYISSSIQLSARPAVLAEVILSTSDILSTQLDLIWILVASIAGVILVVSVVGVLTARQISMPLVQLSEIASELSSHNLETIISIEPTFLEISQVAVALEKARRDLWETLSQLQLEKKWVEHLLDSIVEGILTLDENNRITFFSKGAEKITGWQGNHVLNRTCNEIFQIIESDLSFSQVIPAPGKRQKMNVLLADGRQAILAVTRAELAPTGVREARAVLVFRDISEEEAVHRILGHFLSNIAHEFKTPLSALAASTEILLHQLPGLSPKEQQELINSLNLGIVGLQTLVDNLLESASIEAGHFRVSPRQSDLGEIIASAVRMMKPLMKKYNQKLVLDFPMDMPVVLADRRRIIQVVVNLLSNAIKYGPDNATISIQVEKSHPMVKIKVIDQGAGILEAEREEIFRRFIRLDSSAEKSEAGAGLGLSVVKEIIEAHGGTVGVEGTRETGTEFFFTLPIYQGDEKQ